MDAAESFPGHRRLPAHATPLRLLGVDYIHLPTSDGGDLYVTWHGIHLIDQLRPQNWHEREWFRRHSIPLPGTGAVYRVTTRSVRGRAADLVVKYSRVGQDVPMDTRTLVRFAGVEFNTPYEEFSRVMDLRSRPQGPRILTHRPLGIYVPAARMALWESGRSESRIARKKARYFDVELDILRQYVLIYEWIDGIGADEAFPGLERKQRRRVVEELTERARRDMERKGYEIADHKPTHVIVRPRPDGSILRTGRGEIAYALVDFELLDRTADYRHDVNLSRRAFYLGHQSERFRHPLRRETFPPHLTPVTILGVDYVFGHAESTQGRLWVVGRDPALFDYFLPERWRHTPGKTLSETGNTRYTRSKDNIHLVWKVSHVGEKCAEEMGFNSPFEEVALALDLSNRGIPAVAPRAIYMTGLESPRAELYVSDRRRFDALREIVAENGLPIFRPDHNYLTLWGYWSGGGAPTEEPKKRTFSP